MAPGPMPSMYPHPKRVVIGISVEHGKVRVLTERVKVWVGQQIQWKLEYFDGWNPASLQVYFDEASPFRWQDQILKVEPPGYGNPTRDWITRQPTITAVPETPGDFKYGVRLRDMYDEIVDDDDPYITVLSRL